MGSLSRNSRRASPSCLIFFRQDVTYGSFHVVESALNLHLDLERWPRRKGGGSGGNMRTARGKRAGREGEYKEIRHGYHESSNETRNSSASYFFSPHVRGLHPRAEDTLTSEIQDPVIFTSLRMSCVCRCENEKYMFLLKS